MHVFYDFSTIVCLCFQFSVLSLNCKHANIQTCKHTNTQNRKITNMQTRKYTNKQTRNQAYMQTCKHANKQTCKHANTQTCKPAKSCKILLFLAKFVILWFIVWRKGVNICYILNIYCVCYCVCMFANVC